MVWRSAWMIGVGLVGLSCESAPEQASSAAPAVASSTPTPASASVPAVPPFDQKTFCSAICSRSASCGLAKAEALASAGGPGDKPAIERARSEKPQVEADCNTQCLKSPPPADELERARRVLACVEQKDCAAFTKCVDEAAVK